MKNEKEDALEAMALAAEAWVSLANIATTIAEAAEEEVVSALAAKAETKV